MATDTTADTPLPPATTKPGLDWLPYAAPMALFLLLTTVEGKAPLAWYVPLYALKAVLVTITLLYFSKTWRRELTPNARVVPLAVAVGLAVFGEWIVLDQWIPYPHLGTRSAYNPFEAVANPAVRLGFLALRFYGLTVMVPVMEELFWRSFLLRFFTDLDDFKRVRLGDFSLMAFFLVALGFALAHPEWLVAFVCAAAYALLLRATRSLFACVVAHGVTNLALGVYVVMTGAWKYW